MSARLQNLKFDSKKLSDYEQLKSELKEKEEKVHAVQAEMEKLKIGKRKLKNKERRLKRKEKRVGLQQGNSSTSSKHLDGVSVNESEKNPHASDVGLQLAHLKAEKTKILKQVWYQKCKRRQDYQIEEVEKLKLRIVTLEKEIERLVQINELLERHEVETFRDGMFTNEVREVIMQLLAKQVSMHLVNEVIKMVLEK